MAFEWGNEWSWRGERPVSNSPLDARGLPIGYPFKPEYEITPRDAAALVKDGKAIIVDVRTTPELETAAVAGAQHIELSEIERRADEVDAPEGAEILVLCHHGVRSMKATLALRQLGHPSAKSIAGGIELWSLAVDAGVPRYERGGGVIRRIS